MYNIYVLMYVCSYLYIFIHIILYIWNASAFQLTLLLRCRDISLATFISEIKTY